MATGDGSEAIIPIKTVLVWLSRADPEQVPPLLVGCGLDDGRSEALYPIEDVIAASAVVILGSGRRVALRGVLDGAVVDKRPGHPLLMAVEGDRTPAERRDTEICNELLRRKMVPGELGSAADREQVLRFLVQAERGECPSEPALRAFYAAMKPAATADKHRRAATALEQSMAACARRGDMPESLPWRLAWFLKESGQFEAAAGVTAPAVRGMERAILETIRGSSLVMLGSVRRDLRLLDQAEAALRMAYAMDGGSNEVKAVYRALTRARAELTAGP